MRFPETLRPDLGGIVKTLGGAMPTEQLAEAARDIVAAATPRWVWKRYPLDIHKVPLSGGDIARHLAGCETFIFLAITLGRSVDDAIRAAGADDAGKGLLMDQAANLLIEQYADYAEELLRREGAAGNCLTGRFSPGYGDFSLDAQVGLLRALDAPRTIGLTLGVGGQLLPAKSITAVLGAAEHPVAGLRPGCQHCSMAGRCKMKQ